MVALRPLKQDKNPYLRENLEYFDKRREKLIEAKFRKAIYKLFKQICPVCEESLHNGEYVELHHIIPRKSRGKYSLENIVPLHQICHRQVTHGTKGYIRLQIILKEKRIEETKLKGNE